MIMKRNNNTRRIVIRLAIVIGIGLLSLALSKSDYYKNIARSQKRINSIYKYLVTNYVDEINLDEFTKESVDKILTNVDPYTVYLVEDESSDIDLLTTNAYFGIGVQIGKRDGKLTVISPMDEGPAKRAGMISGDVIVNIDGKPSKDLTIHEASKLIKGPKGTVVKLEIQREGIADLLNFDLERDEIIVKFVSYHGLLDDSTGYIRLTRFGKNARNEMVAALNDLMERNAKNLILDLRDNTGGLLQSALDVLDLFIPRGKLLLETKGRIKTANKEFYSKQDPLVPENIGLAVIINSGSASASEIVAGAIQDLDRGVLLGKTSFGKGLVQSIYPLDKQSTLKITTAKYYIPSGRLIQKPGYIDSAIVNQHPVEKNGYFTLSGRPVTGGGGIVPDTIIDTKHAGPLTQAVWRKGAIFSFVQKQKHKYESFETLTRDAGLMEDFRLYLNTIDLDIRLPGRSGFEESKSDILSADSLNIELNAAIADISAYFQNRENELFDEEFDDLNWRLLSEFKRILVNSDAGTAYALGFDKTVLAARELINDKENYTNLITFHPEE